MNGFALTLAACAMLIVYLCYERLKFLPNIEKWKKLTAKCGCTFCAALLCLWGCIEAGIGANYWLLAGLAVCVAADAMLDVHFVTGMGLFALGHVLYMAAYVQLAKPNLYSLVAFVVLCAGCFSQYFRLKRKYAKDHHVKPVYCLIYAFVLCAMLALAVPQHIVLFLGAVFFVLSDFFLSIRFMHQNSSKAYDYFCLGVYYLAQYLIAASTFFSTGAA